MNYDWLEIVFMVWYEHYINLKLTTIYKNILFLFGKKQKKKTDGFKINFYLIAINEINKSLKSLISIIFFDKYFKLNLKILKSLE